MYDAIVIGVGPSGASAAFECARQGLKILILEKAKLPRYKTCGGAIPFNFFKTLPAAVQKTLKSLLPPVRFVKSGGREIEPVSAPPIAGVMRDEFDHAFAMEAVRHGAELLECQTVTGIREENGGICVSTKDREFTAKYVVGADGAMSVVKRFVGSRIERTGAAAALEAEFEMSESCAENPSLVHFDWIRDGYAWVFPKGRIHSVGLLSFARDKSKAKMKMDAWIRDGGYRFNGNPVHGHPIPVWNKKMAVANERALMVGDAAATVDPLVGEGIRYGIISGRIASRYIVEGVKKGRLDGRAYSTALYRAIYSDFKYARWLARLIYRFPEFCFETGLRHPLATELMGRVLYGELRYKDLLKKIIQAPFRAKTYRRLLSSR